MIKLECRHCKRYLGDVEILVGEILCSNTSCKAKPRYKIINNENTSMMYYKFIGEERKPKGKQ